MTTCIARITVNNIAPGSEVTLEDQTAIEFAEKGYVTIVAAAEPVAETPTDPSADTEPVEPPPAEPKKGRR